MTLGSYMNGSGKIPNNRGWAVEWETMVCQSTLCIYCRKAFCTLQAANMMRCDHCGGKHQRIPMEFPAYSARFCSRCNIRHPAKEVSPLDYDYFRPVYNYVVGLKIVNSMPLGSWWKIRPGLQILNTYNLIFIDLSERSVIDWLIFLLKWQYHIPHSWRLDIYTYYYCGAALWAYNVTEQI